MTTVKIPSSPDYRSDARDSDQMTESANDARQGVTGHNVRYVLRFGLIGVVVLFAAVYLVFFWH